MPMRSMNSRRGPTGARWGSEAAEPAGRVELLEAYSLAALLRAVDAEKLVLDGVIGTDGAAAKLARVLRRRLAIRAEAKDVEGSTVRAWHGLMFARDHAYGRGDSMLPRSLRPRLCLRDRGACAVPARRDVIPSSIRSSAVPGGRQDASRTPPRRAVGGRIVRGLTGCHRRVDAQLVASRIAFRNDSSKKLPTDF